MDLPEALVASYHRSGEAGSAWIAGLPHLVTEALERWGVAPDGPVASGEASLVLPVRDADGRQAVLKLQMPKEESEAAIAGLTAWNGQGIVRLLDHDPTTTTMLLERLDASRTLNQAKDDDAAMGVLAGILARLHAAPAPCAPPSSAWPRLRLGHDPRPRLPGDRGRGEGRAEINAEPVAHRRIPPTPSARPTRPARIGCRPDRDSVAGGAENARPVRSMAPGVLSQVEVAGHAGAQPPYTTVRPRSRCGARRRRSRSSTTTRLGTQARNGTIRYAVRNSPVSGTSTTSQSRRVTAA